MNSILETLTAIYRDYFDEPELDISWSTSAADIPDWDSLAQISLVVIIERHFQLAFTSEEIAELANVGEMVNLIESKQS